MCKSTLVGVCYSRVIRTNRRGDRELGRTRSKTPPTRLLFGIQRVARRVKQQEREKKKDTQCVTQSILLPWLSINTTDEFFLFFLVPSFSPPSRNSYGRTHRRYANYAIFSLLPQEEAYPSAHIHSRKGRIQHTSNHTSLSSNLPSLLISDGVVKFRKERLQERRAKKTKTYRNLLRGAR